MYSALLVIIYLAFISLGLPDTLLGSAWPQMHIELNASLSSAGIITMIISMGTVISSLFSDRLNIKLGTGKVTAISVLMTAVALLHNIMCARSTIWIRCRSCRCGIK